MRLGTMCLYRKTILNLFWILAIEAVVSPLSSADFTKPPEIVNLNVPSDGLNAEIDVSLIPTETFLANENVPVWTTSRTSRGEYSLLKSEQIMKELAPFTMYRDPDTCSAAVYFHKTKQLEGTIGCHHVIHQLKYNPMTKEVEPSKDTVFVSSIPRHDENREPEYIKSGSVKERITSLRPYPDTVYVETLVMVDYDITKEFNYDQAAIVTYVLTLFNTVDMLYSKIEIPNIKINIAGIVIGNVEFPRITPDCFSIYQSVFVGAVITLFADRVFEALHHTLDDYKNHIPFQSYDIVVLLTRSIIRPNEQFPFKLFGISHPPESSYKRRITDVGLAIISESTNFQRFPTVAHEIAHLLGAPHDEGPLLDSDGSCKGNIMRSPGSRCDECISFGGATPSFLRIFFGTRDACIFHNKPRSLNNPQGAQLFWKPREQCECYGYRFAHKSRKCFQIPFFRSSLIDCKSVLKCRNEDNTIHYTNDYMDGTPCARNRNRLNVCWEGECVPLGANSKSD